ncbi:MAG: protein kinase [Rhodobacterales bacterium]|nr:protein kinase [Rhodobacterales bacterium]
MNTSHQRLKPGTQIGGYIIQHHLGQGGMSDVYQVADVHSGDIHALKLLYDIDSRVLFELEYEVMVRLNHPGVVRTYRYGVHDGAPWISMEALSGSPAHVHIKAFGIPGGQARTVEAIRVSTLVARALEYVHGRDIVHRDLKPGNVIVLPDGRVRLVDFGVALRKGVFDRVSREGGFVGTPGYAAPEQFTATAVDQRADLFALGVMMYRLLNGRLPFRGHDITETLRQVLQAPSPPRNKWAQDVPEKLAVLIEQLLEKSVDKRTGSAAEVAIRLDGISGKSVVTGTSLAIHRSDPVLRSQQIIQILDGLDTPGVLFVTSEDGAHRRAVLERLVNAARARDVAAGLAVLDDPTNWGSGGLAQMLVMSLPDDELRHRIEMMAAASKGDRRWGNALVNAARRSGEQLVFLLACDLVASLNTDAVDLLKSLSDVAGPSLQLTLVLGSEPNVTLFGHVAHAFREAEQVVLQPLTPLESTLAVGSMLGRRPPSGALGLQIYARTQGWPSHIASLTRELVLNGGVQAEGDRVLWARQDLELPVPEGFRYKLEDDIRKRTRAERTVLDVICVVGGIRLEGLIEAMSLPRPAMESSVVDLLDDGMLRRDEDGILHIGTTMLDRVVNRNMGSSLRGMLERMLLRHPGNIPQTPFRIRALMVAERVDEAASEALQIVEPFVVAGEWKQVMLVLDGVVDGLMSDVSFTDDLVRVHLLHAQSVLAMRLSGTLVAQTVAKVRKHVSDPLQLSQCDLVSADLQRSIGHYGNYFKSLSSAVENAGELADLDLRQKLNVALGRGYLWKGDPRAANRLLTRVLDEAEGQVNNRGLRLIGAAAEACVVLGEVERAEKLSRMAMAGSDNDPVVLGESASVLARVLAGRGNYSEALHLLATVADQLRMKIDPRAYVTVLLGIARCEIELHRLGLAQDCLDEIASVIRPGELLHVRLEASLLEGRMRVMSGESAGAVYLLQSVAERARAAGLQPLADEAGAYTLEAQHVAGLPGEPLESWFDSRKLSYMADKNIWAFARSCWLYQRVAKKPVNPDRAFSILLEAMDGKDLLPMRVELNLARAIFHWSGGSKRGYIKAIVQAENDLQTILGKLQPSEDGALRVHPWRRRLLGAQRALAEAEKTADVAG